MKNHANTTTTEGILKDYFNDSYSVNIADPNISTMYIFGAFDIHNKPKNDPAYIQWKASLFHDFENGSWHEEIIPVRVCNKDDFKKLYFPKNEFIDVFERRLGTGGLFCLDTVKPINVKGDYTFSNRNILDIQLEPCQDTNNDLKCGKSLPEVEEYLEGSNMVIFYNHEHF